ncbi:hypothetical protein [Actinokineospora fastidiosa]|uniref:Uncharacterized protein n=1 Tax=Actinokineospora fastidiosa TaxID=1816 RepID=A0A918GL91_9PSEU|nr:hypothetical protein [Actinokineospora fastidiosa]GGS42801.1 hypothetical protein GCM10010171_42290 [Actinokineospora fastidiosa]
MIDDVRAEPAALRAEDIAPFFSFTLLEYTSDDPGTAFAKLRDFVRTSAGRTRVRRTARAVGELYGDSDRAESIRLREATGIDEVFGIVREQTKAPSWAMGDSPFTDLVHDLVVIARRGRFVALHGGEIISDRALDKWVDRPGVPFRRLPHPVLAGLFPGDVRMAWMKGTHRPRTTKADTIAKGGLRLQEESKPLEAASYALRAAKTDFDPQDATALLRGSVIVSPDKSRVSWANRTDLITTLRALVETFESVDKALVAEKPPDPILPDLAVREADLATVRCAIDISVATTFDHPLEDYTEEHLDRIGLLQGALMDVTGKDRSAEFIVDVGRDGSVCGQLLMKPIRRGHGYMLDVRLHGTPSAEAVVREIRHAIGDGDLLTVHFESGHAFIGNQIYRQNPTGSPFRGYEFADFTGFTITREKPNVAGDQNIHEAIAVGTDSFLFTWVARRYSTGELICDDGAGEIADFLHLDNDGTLTAIHVKAADSASAARQVSLTRYEQVASQAVKNIRALANDELISRLSSPRVGAPASWSDGNRVPDRSRFIEGLRARVDSDETYVVIVQPHLLQSVHDRAREAMAAGAPSAASRRLQLLDDLLNGVRASVVGQCDDLIVIGSADY